VIVKLRRGEDRRQQKKRATFHHSVHCRMQAVKMRG
jgi:hypothetical protein